MITRIIYNIFVATLLGVITYSGYANQAKKIDPELSSLLKESITDEQSSFDDKFDAEVWLVSKLPAIARYVKQKEQRLTILKAVHREAKRAQVSAELVLAIIHIESHFDRFALSSAGAQGMMQVMPFWKKEIGRERDNLMDTNTNLRYGCTILKHYLKRADGDWMEALARYNGSYGKTKYVIKVMDVWEKYWK